MAVATIYLLADPSTGEPRYLGVTQRALSVRVQGHIDAARSGAPRHCASWIRGLLLAGVRPAVLVVDVVPSGADWTAVEQEWIRWLREGGVRLTNICDGGEGATHRHTAETRAKMSRTRKGRKRTESERAAISAGRRRAFADGRLVMTFSPETRAKLSAAQTRVWRERRGDDK